MGKKADVAGPKNNLGAGKSGKTLTVPRERTVETPQVLSRGPFPLLPHGPKKV